MIEIYDDVDEGGAAMKKKCSQPGCDQPPVCQIDNKLMCYWCLLAPNNAPLLAAVNEAIAKLDMTDFLDEGGKLS
jgi:hypothetical protein